MCRSSTSIVITNSISIISPDISEVFDEVIVLIVVFHLVQEISVADVELFENCLKSNECKFGLEKVCSVEAIKAIGPKDSIRLFQNCIGLAIIHVISQIELHVSYLNDNFIYFFIISACNLMMEIIIQILQIWIDLTFYMILELVSQHSFSFFAH